jgi:hypothetical protein
MLWFFQLDLEIYYMSVLLAMAVSGMVTVVSEMAMVALEMMTAQVRV